MSLHYKRASVHLQEVGLNLQSFGAPNPYLNLMNQMFQYDVILRLELNASYGANILPLSLRVPRDYIYLLNTVK